MSLFGALYIGDSGLRTSQNALNTVAHNLSNLGTVGYVRQQVAQSDTTYTNSTRTQSGYPIQIGDGVKYSECRHVRDQFLDMAYRAESGRLSFYEVSYAAILEVEDIMGEFDGAAFSNSLSGLWTAMEELSKYPNDSTNIAMLVSKSASFIENAMSVYNSFQEYQSNLNRQIKDSVADINAIGERIVQLNEEISRIEVGGVEHANDLRDERDSLLDTLSEYGNITYQEDANSMLAVQFNGNDFITQSKAFEMKLLTDEDTGYVTPYWGQNVVYKEDAGGNKTADYSSAYVFKSTDVISTERDTDIGSLRALLLARGDHVADYTDLDVNMCTQRKLDALGITAEEYNSDYGLKYYNDYISNSVMMNIEGEFDHLINTVATTINKVLADNCDPVSGYLCNDDGTPIQMFLKSNSEPYEKVFLTENEATKLMSEGVELHKVYDEQGNEVPNSYWRFVEEEGDSGFTLYNCSNITINHALLKTPMLLGFKKEEESVDFNIGKAFVDAFQAKEIYLNPNSKSPTTFENCYVDLTNEAATIGYIFRGMYEFEQLAVEQKDNERQTVIGVSSDEELEHMIMYQNAYNAASRYINVVNELLDTLLGMAA